MIFVTVGEQLPFDRLVMAVDDWASLSNEKVIAQIGDTDFIPQNMEYQKYYLPSEYQNYINAADCIIAHAGMGSIITALEQKKPIIIMPRQQKLGEHRTDHQFATAEKFRHYPSIVVATDILSLSGKLVEMDCIKKLADKSPSVGPSPKLIDTIRNFIK